MPGRYNFEVESRSTWRQSVRYAQPSANSREKRKPVDLTGWHAILQARTRVEDEDALLTVDSRESPQGDGAFEPLDETGVIRWSVDMGGLSDLPAKAQYELMLIDPDGAGKVILKGQLELTVGVIDGP